MNLNDLHTVEHELRESAEDTEDARIIEHAKKAHGKQPRIHWLQAKKESDLP